MLSAKNVSRSIHPTLECYQAYLTQDNIDILAQRFLKKLDGCIAMTFKKIRVSTTKEIKQDELYKKRRELKNKGDERSKMEFSEVDKEIAQLAQDKYNQVMQDLNEMRPNEGKINSQKFWKMKKKMCQRNIDPPSVMFDAKGNILTADSVIQNRALKVYTYRLAGNKIKSHLKDHEEDVNKLCDSRLKLSRLKKVEP